MFTYSSNLSFSCSNLLIFSELTFTESSPLQLEIKAFCLASEEMSSLRIG